jgi:hypothetical protein
MRSSYQKLLAAVAVVFTSLGALAMAADADTDWQAVVALDAGPGEQPKNPEEASRMVLNHLARQEKAVRTFVAEHAADARVFEAQLRLARLLQIRADFEHTDKPRVEARRILDQLEKTATAEQRPELEFSKLARLMRSLKPGDNALRDDLLKAARQFQTSYPKDRRLAAVFAEVATQYDGDPKKKEILLEDARSLATDDELKARIADDIKRVRLFGHEVPLRFTAVQGQEFKLDDLAGRPAFVIFFAHFSPPSLAALDQLQQAVASLPKGSVSLVGVCLDERREVVDGLIKGRNITWPLANDGKGWDSPLVRSLGINALPTVWLVDGRGRLRSLNALEGAAGKARALMQERGSAQ